jgi:hypothetical protein
LYLIWDFLGALVLINVDGWGQVRPCRTTDGWDETRNIFALISQLIHTLNTNIKMCVRNLKAHQNSIQHVSDPMIHHQGVLSCA